jgi:uncharacterized membrane protein
MTTEHRIRELELGQEELWQRLIELERRRPAPVRKAPAPPPPRPLPEPESAPPAPSPAPRRTSPSFEDLLGGRILALIGAVAVVLSGAFFFALAVSNGWIGEAARTGLAAVGSVGVFALGVWLHERRGRTYASLSITGAALACMFLTVTVAAEVYDLIPASVALALAMLVGACGTALAIRWTAVPIGAIGIIGALLSPVLAGAPQTGTTLALLFVANAAAVAVLLWQRWDWLGFACALVAGPQWVYWVVEFASVPGTLLALVAFGALGVGAAIGFELRVPAAHLRVSSAYLLALNALGLALVGWFALVGDSEQGLAQLWLCFLAVAHLAVGVTGTRLERISRDIALLALVIGVVLADIAFSLIVSGPAVAVGYAGAGVLLAWLLRRERGGLLPETVIGIGLGGHIVLALAHVLDVDAPVAALAGEPIDMLAAVLVLGSVSGAVFASARLLAKRYSPWRVALDSLGLALVGYTAVLLFDGALLVAVLAAGAVVLARLAQQTGDELMSGAAATCLGAGVGHALAIEAPAQALVFGVDSLPSAVAALAACGSAALVCAHLWQGDRTSQLVLRAGGAAALLYLASVAIVTAFQPGGTETAVLELPVRQQGQVLVSALWGFAGLCALLVGLRRDVRELRVGALALLLATVAKVFLYDLSTLGSVYRVVSFLALGALLLAASFAYQRLRPTPLPDLREMSRALQ